ncbi:MAG TPA: cobalamin-independent methionine synthase II family protein [Acidimicrobiales bacterium]|nr:cobalamin-independent methionine synthase II family protein [Acidimicrobiales bacterium]
MAGKQSTAKAEVVGSLLQPERLLEARKRLAAGEIDASELAKIEDETVLECIAIQEGVGLDVITDGEMRRPGWADTARHLGGLEARPGERSYPANVHLAAGGGGGGSNSAFAGGFPTVVGKIHPLEGYKVGEEYPYLTQHTNSRTKYTMAAPSYHRRYWSDELSTSAYPSCEDFLSDVRDWLHGVAEWLVSQGCDYIQLDAPNYGSLCDPDNRAFHKEHGHDLDAQLAFDGKLDSSVFDGLDGVTRALHVCRGNMPGGTWHSSGGYGAIADQLFPNLDVDVVLLEYDSDRAGDFGPISAIDPESTVVLGLLTTKAGELEDRGVVESRIAEAGRHHPAANFALSTQCGFASAANAPMSPEEQRAKLQLISDVAHSTWS